MLLDEAGERALVYVQQPYMNLDEASILREEIDASSHRRFHGGIDEASARRRGTPYQLGHQ